MRLQSGVVVALALGLLACGVDSEVTGPLEGTVFVEVRDNGFTPDTVTVQAGRAVRWTNRGPAVHTIAGPGFTSDNLFLNWWFEVQFTTPGAYDYTCTLHQEKVGTVIVSAAP